MHRLPALLEMIGSLISIPSISSVKPQFDQSNRPLIERLAQWLDGAGYAVELIEVPHRPDKVNLVATLGRGPGGLVLAGHTDTVPYDEDRWQHDPFRMTRSDGRLFGLGTSDMKAFLALAIEAASQYQAAQLREPLILLATADEESSMDGAKALLDARRPQARYAVIGEPTGLRPVRMHKGMMMEAIRLEGRSGHSSDPRLGNNALEGMHKVIGELLRWRDELQAQHRSPLFEVPVPTLNLGHIHGGDNPNRICARCELHIDLRPLPGMEIEALRAALHARLQPLAEHRGLALHCEPLFDGIPAMETAPGAAIVSAAEQLTGYPAGAVAFGTEAPYLSQMGLETLVLGPGDIDQAHQPDEYLREDRIQPTIALLRELIERFCVNPSGTG